MIFEKIGEGETYEIAVEEAKRLLNAPEDVELHFETVQEARKRLFGIKKEPAKVKVWYEIPDAPVRKEAPAKKAAPAQDKKPQQEKKPNREQHNQKNEQEKIDKEKRLQQAELAIKKRFGKNALIRGLNLQEGATGIERNKQTGGHKS